MKKEYPLCNSAECFGVYELQRRSNEDYHVVAPEVSVMASND